MDNNLTFGLNVLKPHVGVKPVEGHTVVVFEKMDGAGEEFRFEIEPGQSAPTSGLDVFLRLLGRRNDRFFSYAVTGDPQLRTTFSTDVTLRSRIHTLALRITLAYRVSQPRKLVIRRNDDPVRKVRDEVAAKMRAEFARCERDVVLVDFDGVARDIVSATIGEIRDFAATYGILVESVSLDHTLSADELQRLREIEKAEREKEEATLSAEVQVRKITTETAIAAARAQYEHTINVQRQTQEYELQAKEQEHIINNRLNADVVANFQRLDKLADALVNAGTQAIGTAGASIQNPKDLLQAIGAMRTAVSEMSFLHGGGGERAIGGGTGTMKLLGGATSGPSAVIAEMFERTMEMGLGLTDRQQLQSAILHLIAELLLERDASPDLVDDYLRRVSAVRGKVEDADNLDYLEKFVDRARLARELR